MHLRIVVGLVLFALLSSLATVYVFNRAMPVLEQPAYDRAIENARALDEKINHTLFTYYSDIQQAATTPTALDAANWAHTVPTNPLVAAMNASVKKDEFNLIALYLDMNGNVRAVSTQSAKGKALLTDSYYAQNFATTPWFTHARDGKFLEGKSGASGTAITGPVRDASIAKAFGDDGYVLVFSTQVKDATGKAVGVWAQFVDFDAIETLITQQQTAFKNQGLTHTQITLMDATGLVLADVKQSAEAHARDFAVIGKANLVTEKYKPALEGLANKKGTSLIPATGKGDEGTIHLVSFFHSEEIFNPPGLGWTVLLQFDRDEIFSSLNDAAKMIVQGLAVVMAGMLLLALLVSRIITKRMRRAKAALTQESSELTRLKALEETMPTIMANTLAAQKEETAAEFEASIRPAVTQVNEAAAELRTRAEAIETALAQPKTRAAKICAAIGESAKLVKQTTTTARKFNGEIRDLNNQIETAATGATNAQTQAKDLHKEIGAVVKHMDGLHTAATALTSLAKHLNLLALNATIEAARAGDTNKGAGLLATEIKTLAADMTQTVQGLTQQAQGLQQATQHAATTAELVQATTELLTRATTSMAGSAQQQQAASTEFQRLLDQLVSASTPLAEDSGFVEKSVAESGAAAKALREGFDSLTDHTQKLGEKAKAFGAVATETANEE